jgi:sugar/nucleoside kinase (ribokinase family)
MDVPTGTALAAARTAKGAGARLVYSPGVRCAEGYDALSKILTLVDDAVFDRSELLKLRPSRSPREALLSMAGEIPTLAAVATLGPSGCLVGKEGSVDPVPPVSLESLGLKAVNSTGSGDAFLAAYVCYSNFGRGPKDAARWGNLAGALKATSGATRGSPGRRVLESRMAELSMLTGRRRG